MPLVSMRQVLDAASDGAYGVGAFTVANWEQLEAVMEAAQDTASPVVVQASPGARAPAGERFLMELMTAATQARPDLPVALHLDRGNAPAACAAAIDLGFTSVMVDGSVLEDERTPASLAYNVDVTSRVVQYAHARGVSVEGAVGTVDQAVEFVRRTVVDALAVATGTGDGEILAMALIEELHRRVPETHLVMHGAGGRLAPGFAVPVWQIQQGIRHGVRKINVATDGRRAIDARHLTKADRDGMRAVVAERMRQFGQAGHAGDYAPLTPREMSERYAAASGGE
jgi:fructose-bisphosphate aldolase, class II